jgi:fatty acid desaturase
MIEERHGAKRIRFFYLQFLIIILLSNLSYFLTFEVSFFLLPISFVINTNIFIRLFSLGHDGIHGLLCDNKNSNDFLARYLCHTPIFFSFSRYKHLHLLHHKYVGSKYDPDYLIDLHTPKELKKYFWYTSKRILTFHQFYTAVLFYTDITRIYKSHSKQSLNYKKDSLQLLVVWSLIITFCFTNSIVLKFVLLWWFCLLFFPLVVELFSLIQHRELDKKNPEFTRNIVEKGFLAEVFFPTGIAFHGIHHEDVRIPWYNLKNLKRNESYHIDSDINKCISEIFE